jgi:hypothetical protein
MEKPDPNARMGIRKVAKTKMKYTKEEEEVLQLSHKLV